MSFSQEWAASNRVLWPILTSCRGTGEGQCKAEVASGPEAFALNQGFRSAIGAFGAMKISL
jgi:hypothetical protein